MDLKKMKQKLRDLENNQGGKSKMLWKPEPGRQVVRIVPNKLAPDWPFIELYFYYDLSNKTIISPISFDKPDPVKEFSDGLMKSGDPEDYKMAKQLQPKFRCYVPILVRGQESEGVKYWGFGNQIYSDILKTLDDPDYGDITDLETGRDLTVEFTAPEKKGEFGKTIIRPKPNASFACADSEVEKKVAAMPDIRSVWPEMEYDELKVILSKFLNAASTADELPEPKKLEDNFLAEISVPVKQMGTSKVSKEFAKLFDDDEA